MNVSPKLKFNLDDICKKIIDFGFNLRLSLNMTSVYNHIVRVGTFFERFSELGANQITFREMYYSNNNTKEDDWIKDHLINPDLMDAIKQFITENGKPNYVLPFGAVVYSIRKMSTVVDTDCMDSKTNDDVLKYLILREDGKLYSKWDDEGTLIF